MRTGICNVRRRGVTTTNYFAGCRTPEDRHRDTFCRTIGGIFRFVCMLAFFAMLSMAATAMMAAG